MKKNIRISNVSLSSGNAENSATIRTFKPLILEIALSGRRTLKILKLAGLNPASSYSTFLTTGEPFFKATAGPASSAELEILDQLMMTMLKSRQFQGSLMYAFSSMMKPRPTIFKAASSV